jgi:hypothetical protein
MIVKFTKIKKRECSSEVLILKSRSKLTGHNHKFYALFIHYSNKCTSIHFLLPLTVIKKKLLTRFTRVNSKLKTHSNMHETKRNLIPHFFIERIFLLTNNAQQFTNRNKNHKNTKKNDFFQKYPKIRNCHA